MENKVIIYQTPDGQTQLDVRFEDETVWLTQLKWQNYFKRIELLLESIFVMFTKKVNLTKIAHVQNLHIWVMMGYSVMKQRYITLM